MAPLAGVWYLESLKSTNLPGPDKVWAKPLRLVSGPFNQNDPNDQGIGGNVLSCLKCVGIGFGVAALVGIPLGFPIGRSAFPDRTLDPSSACCAR